MDKATEIIQSQTQQTKPSTQSTPTYAHSEEGFDYVWRGLQAGRLLTKDMVINGTDYHYWRENLKDLTDKHLKAGFDNSGTFHGYLTWSEFRKLCFESYQARTEQNRYVPPTTARLNRPETLGTKRFQELHKVTRAMSAEEGDGPITKATKNGKLNRGFIRGKTAQQIIDYCQQLYG